jgi:hypothetical protein
MLPIELVVIARKDNKKVGKIQKIISPFSCPFCPFCIGRRKEPMKWGIFDRRTIRFTIFKIDDLRFLSTTD